MKTKKRSFWKRLQLAWYALTGKHAICKKHGKTNKNNYAVIELNFCCPDCMHEQLEKQLKDHFKVDEEIIDDNKTDT